MGSGSANGGGGRDGGTTGHAGDWSRPASGTQVIYKIGVYGWRKRCLYVFILFLMVAIIINMALTVWILRVMDFSVHGMGKLRIAENGVRVEGDAEFLKALYARHIKSRQNAALYLESSRNITLNARDANDKIINKLFIGSHKVESYARHFEVREPGGEMLFYANKDEVYMGADKLTVGGSGGAVFKGSVQTPIVRAELEDLKLESPTNKVDMFGTKQIKMRSPVGGIDLQSLTDFKVTSRNGEIILNAASLHITNLTISSPFFTGRPYAEVYQLCICSNSGRLFVSAPQGNCQASIAICNS